MEDLTYRTRKNKKPAMKQVASKGASSSSTSGCGDEQKEKFTFFFRANTPFSQFHPSKFQGQPLFITEPEDEKGYTFHHCEQWMMFNKAKLFKDEETAKKILETSHPPDCKALGRKVKNFDENVWKRNNEKIVMEGNRLKFSQNARLFDELMNTDGTTLVEASPFDRLYGIGLSATNPKAQNRSTWRGINLLGQILTKLREELKLERKDTATASSSCPGDE